MASVTPRIEWLDEIASTNAYARNKADEGERGPLWIAAHSQTEGRGRRGRSWIGQEGNLFTTGLYTLQSSPARIAELSFVAALAVADVCDIAIKDRDRTKLKWPNDVMVDDCKVSGILLESGNASGGGIWLAVGIGLNLVAAPTKVDRPAISLNSVGEEMSSSQALEELVKTFEFHKQKWMLDGFGPIRDAWLSRAWKLGERCKVQLSEETFEGVFADLGPDGALRLDLDGGGRRYIAAGDVYFPQVSQE